MRASGVYRVLVVGSLLCGAPSAASAAPGEPVSTSFDLAGWRKSGELEIQSISLEDVPETLPEGGSFPYRVLGLDSFGGRPDLTDRATLIVTPPPALILTADFRAMTRVQGPLTIQPRLQSLAGAA